MIVRDEAPIIERCLTSMQNIVNSYYIMDTGSLDNTPEVITEFMKNQQIPGDIGYAEWKNFGHNKSLLLKNAREHSNELISKAEYYVWLDADEVWITNKNDPTSYFTKEDTNKLYEEVENTPNSDIFQICTLYSSLEYFRWNIVRNTQLYEWKQPVHEYLEGTVRNNNSIIEWFYLLARKEGNSSRSPDRFQKDILMFEEFLIENPNEPRAMFYLAQTYEESGYTEKGIEMYKKRIECTEGYYAERYIACLRLGRICSIVAEKKKWWIEGTTIDPLRLECYYELLMLEHNSKNFRAALGWGFMAPTSRKIENGFMFAEKDIYNYNFDLYFSLSAYYSEYYQLGYDINKQLLSRVDKTHHLYELFTCNLEWFIKKMNVQEKTNSLTNNVVQTLAVVQNLPVPRQEFIIIENFYDKPDYVRAEALIAEYNVTGNYPGTRTKPYLYDGIREKFERIIGRPIRYWPTDGYNGAFQYTNETMISWIHRDMTEWSAIVFLTPDAPADGGTKFYTHKGTKLSYAPNEEVENYLQKDTADVDKWILTDRIGNVYNRCVLFRGKRTHISDRYFGNSKENGRIFQTFFFDD